MATHQHQHGPVHVDEADWAESAAQTELEGELLIGFVTGTVERIKALRSPAAPVRRVLDIGSGPPPARGRPLPDSGVIRVGTR